MLRFRRYRVFLICAILMTVALVRMSRTRQWDNETTHRVEVAWDGSKDEPNNRQGGTGVSKAGSKNPQVETKKLAEPSTLSTSKSKTLTQEVVDGSKTSLIPTPTSLILSPIAEDVIPDRTLAPPTKVYEEENKEVHQEGPGRGTPIVFSPAPPVIHWEKQIEHFPVPSDSIIQLPTGEPLPIPKIQYKFKDETVSARAKREERLDKVREEFKRAWNGYKTRAWMHDELSPVSGENRDPFAGWAATLVDSLDTLYIMGLNEDFEEAVKAVGTIDFTTAKRQDIQMFETTIRYLGGLLAAYDVSGGTKKILLDKAVELAEVMMGAFDTPNRMPILYYNWKPTFASQPHRASTRSNLAELGSLSMEFTHLAQLTKEPKYYDAVARITDALFEWQERGTTGLAGVFPQDVDAAGCNRSSPTIKHNLSSSTPIPLDPLSASGEGYQPPSPKNVKEPKPVKGKGAKELADIELSVIPGEPSQARLERILPKPIVDINKVSKRIEPGMESSNETLPTTVVTDLDQVLPASPAASVSELARDIARMPSKNIEDLDCVPQGLEPSSVGYGSFSMGGSQDSTYEYFSKQYLLLGGLEEKYRSLYLGTMKAVRDHMLFRPMVPNNRDILFSGKLNMGGPDGPSTFEPEVTHLTCFLGGMVGMGAKIFGLEEIDLEIAKKLSDGCVWAYESMDTGVMPEQAQIYLCQKDTECQWNETLWKESLDPMADQREQQIEDYERKKAIRKAHEEQALSAGQAKSELELEEKEANPAIEPVKNESKSADHDLNEVVDSNGLNGDSTRPVSTQNEESEAEPGPDSRPRLQKRELEEENFANDKSENEALKKKTSEREASEKQTPEKDTPEKDTPEKDTPGKSTSKNDNAEKELLEKDTSKADFSKEDDLDKSISDKSSSVDEKINNEKLQKKLEDTETELDAAAPGRQVKNPSKDVPKVPAPSERGPDPQRPPTHEEYVEAKIKLEGLPPGFTKIQRNIYILRPEAIESVWYMYRITGDPIWQEKGWTMFEHIIRATSTTYGHSAFYGVTGDSGPDLMDEMESFWLAETLKYFYLLYSTPDVISLDDWVLNTEAHPFRRPT